MAGEEAAPRKVADLREGEDNVDVKVRVLSAEPPKVIHTQRGDRTISEAIVGDDTGRVKLTAWGNQAGKLKEGDAVELQGAWTTSFRGEVQLNIGSRGAIKKLEDTEVPKPEDIPENTPKAQGGGFGSRRGPRRGGGRPPRRYGGYGSRPRGGGSEEGEESEEF